MAHVQRHSKSHDPLRHSKSHEPQRHSKSHEPQRHSNATATAEETAGVGAKGEESDPDKTKTEVEEAKDKDKDVEAVSEAPPKRDKWTNKIAYICTLVGYAVGFGNIWRFPYRFRENGGIAFLVPYFFVLAFVGIPVFFLELAVGQRIRKGLVYCWNDVHPYFGGLGITCGFLCFIVGLYYNTLLAYVISYFIESFRNPLHWTNCKKAAIGPSQLHECLDQVDHSATKYYFNRRTLGISTGIDDPGGYNWPLAGYHLISWLIIYGVLVKGTKSVEFVVYLTSTLPYVVLVMFFIFNLSIDPKHAWLGAYRVMKPDWWVLIDPNTWLQAGGQLFFSLGLGYGCLIIFASYSPAKNDCHRDAVLISIINCGTSVFAALVVLPLIGLFGYKKWDKCLDTAKHIFPDLKLWTDPQLQHKHYDVYFFTSSEQFETSMTVNVQYGYGELQGKKAGEPLDQDEKGLETVNVANLNASYLGLHIRPLLKNCSIGELATASGAGTGFVFMGFTEAVLYTPGSNFWALLFFFMLFLLGVDSGFGTVEGAVNAFEDITGLKRWKATSIVVGTEFVLALLLFPFGWGIYVLDLLDTWTANYTFLAVALVECIAIAWVYGLANFAYDVRLMTGKKPNMFILLSWKYFTPIIITIQLVGSIVKYIYDNVKGINYSVFRPNQSYHEDHDYDGQIMVSMPRYAIAVGLLLMFFLMSWVPIQAILKKCTKYSLLKRRDPPGDFPEAELRDERHIDVDREEDQFTSVEKFIMGQGSLQSLQKHRDEFIKNTSKSSMERMTRKSKNRVAPQPES